MAIRRWKVGAVIRKALDDGFTYYARLLEFPWAAFYDFRTPKPVADPRQIVAHPVLFTVAAHKDLVGKGEWETCGQMALEASLRPPGEQFIQDPLDASDCQIIDDKGNMRAATPQQCEGLEPAAVWEPEHIADRLTDHYAGRPNRWAESMKLRRDGRS